MPKKKTIAKRQEGFDYHQYSFKLQTEWDMERWENLQFLKEMQSNAIKAFEKRDIVSQEMLLKMIGDWIHQLEKQTK